MKFRIEIPFVDLLGFELLRFEQGEAEIALQLRDELSNSWGVAHGGVTMTLSTWRWRTQRAAPAKTASPSAPVSSRSR